MKPISPKPISKARLIAGSNWKMPPSAQPAAQEAPTSSVPTRIATATSVETCSQLIGRGSGGEFRSGLAMRECLAGEPPARKSILAGAALGDQQPADLTGTS